MKKIPTLFLREQVGRRFLAKDEVNPECQWVLDGEGRPTEKFDGTACLIKEGVLYKRQRVKQGKGAPPGWFHWSEDPSVESGHGWAPITEHNADRWHRDALINEMFEDGTYELVGPAVQKNPYGFGVHRLWRHGAVSWSGAPRTFEEIKDWLTHHSMEGIVWHHPDGRMAKIKRRDFGIPWPDNR